MAGTAPPPAVCGRSAALKASLEKIADGRKGGALPIVKVIGFTSQMDELMAAADPERRQPAVRVAGQCGLANEMARQGRALLFPTGVGRRLPALPEVPGEAADACIVDGPGSGPSGV